MYTLKKALITEYITFIAKKTGVPPPRIMFTVELGEGLIDCKQKLQNYKSFTRNMSISY